MKEEKKGRPWHFIPKNKSRQRRLHWVFFDTETQVVHEDEKVQKQKLKLGYAVHIRFDRAKKCQKQIFFTTPEEFGKFIESSVHEKERLHIASMNLAFDFAVSGIGRYLHDAGWKLQGVFINESCSILQYRKEKKKIIFLDIWNFVKSSVRQLGEVLDFPKLDIDFENCTDEELRRYCARDVHIITYFIGVYQEFVLQHDLGCMGITTPQQAFTSFRHRFMKKRILVHNHKETLELEREAYHGGRSECFFIGRKEEKVYALDVNSMYPYVMKENLFPARLKLYSFGKLKLSLMEKFLYDYCIIARVEIETDEPVYPCRTSERLIFPVGRFWTTLCTGSLRYAMEKGHVRNLDVFSMYNPEDLFSEFVQFFYGLKQYYRSEKNPVFEKMAKLILNSLYGKFGQRVKEIEPVGEDPFVEMGIREVKDIDSGERWREIIVNHTIYVERTEEEESIHSFPAIAAHVTDYARLHLWKLIQKAGRKNVLYVDTDSLFVNREGYERLQDEISPDELGKLKLEHVWDWIEIHGCKDYEYPGGVKRKGIRSTARQLSENEFEQLHFPTFRGIIRKSQSGFVEVEKVKKRLSRQYEKGIVNEDGSVDPIRL